MVGAVLVLLVAGAVARATGGEDKVDVRDGTTAVTAAELAGRYGIDLSLLAVTAAGGMIDLRFQVVDPDKANGVIHDTSLLPILVVEESGATLAMSALPHSHNTRLELGGTYFFHMANAHSAVQPGSHVTLVIGDARLEHVKVQG